MGILRHVSPALKNPYREDSMAGWKLKKFSLAGLFLLATILLVACNRPFDDEIAHYLAHGPTSVRPYVATGPSCTELEEIAQETLANVLPPPATARFSAADRQGSCRYRFQPPMRVGERSRVAAERHGRGIEGRRAPDGPLYRVRLQPGDAGFSSADRVSPEEFQQYNP